VLRDASRRFVMKERVGTRAIARSRRGSHFRHRQKLHSNRKGCLRPVLGPLVRALSSPGVRSLSMLVCSLLILKGTPTGVATIKRRGRQLRRPRHFHLSAAF
jgi:hypothetical protein